MAHSKLICIGVGALLAALGATVAGGWLLHRPPLLELLIPDAAIMFNTGLCFLLAGVALLLDAHGGRRALEIARVVGALLIGLPALVLANTLLGLSLPIDLIHLHEWYVHTSPNPGRMAPNACIGFMLAGALVLTLAARPDRRSATSWFLLIALFTVAMSGLVGQLLNRHLLLSRLQFSMLLPTAAAMLLLVVGLFASLQRRAPVQDPRPDRAIIRAAIFTLSLGVLVSGLSGFVMLVGQTETAIVGWLKQKLTIRVALLEEAIGQARETNRRIATDPVIAGRLIETARAGRDGASPGPIFRADLDTIGLSRAQILTPARTLIAEQGKAPAARTVTAYLGDSGDELYWDRTLVLRSSHPLRDAASGELLGYFVAERPLPRLAGQLTDDSAFATTGDIRLCTQAPSMRMDCFPSERHPQGGFGLARVLNGDPVPMSLALDGASGVTASNDFRGISVVAAYAPLGEGLGLVVKQDSEEIFAPIRERLTWMLPLMILLIGSGAWLMQRQVRPVASALARSERDSRHAREELASVVASISDGLIIINGHGTVLFANSAAEAIFGFEPGTMTGHEVRELMPHEFRAAHDAGLRRYAHDGTRHVVGGGTVELVGLRRDGSQFPMELAVDAVAHDGSYTFVGIVRDISARAQVQQALTFEKERLRVTLHSIGDAVLTTDRSGRLTYLNPAAERLLAVFSPEVIGLEHQGVLRLVDEATGDPCASPIALALARTDEVAPGFDCCIVRGDGSRFAAKGSATVLRSAAGELEGVVLVFQDVTETRALVSRITHQATHDPLTDLPNRREFEVQLDRAITEPDAGGVGHALLYIDLDQFKVVNDTCGHAAGDQLLKQVARALQDCLRSSDLLARLGGDEFAVLLRRCPVEPASRIAEKMRAALERLRFAWGDRSFTIGGSIGLVPFGPGDCMSQVLSAADSACYIAKEKGRNRVHVHHARDADVVQRNGELDWASRLRNALESDRFVLYAQRIVATCEDAPADRHYEVLVRLQDEAGELVPPMAFIPAAERYGLMPSIDRWVIDRALSSLVEGRDSPRPTRLSINLSGRTLGDESLQDFVAARFEQYGVPFAQVCFEITETAAIANFAHAERFMRWFRSRGGRLSLDDFGSGVSSFGYLKRLPVDYLKIDGAFVCNLLVDPADDAMVAAINNVGHVMGIRTVAEFVESQDTFARLRGMRVDYAQGYGIHRPEPLAALLGGSTVDASATDDRVAVVP